MEFKKMTISDLNKISNNLNKFDDFWTLGIFKEELINPNSYYILAIENGEIVGFGGINTILDESSLNNIAVRVDKRSQKIGSKILEKLIEISQNLGSSFLTLEVNKNNLNAIKLYEKFGFKNLGIRKNYYNGTTDAIIMTLYFPKNI